MCTILILHGVRPDVPLVIAANRDEFYGRPSTAPQVLHDHPRAIGGIDGVRSGTWMGATATGFFAGVTNQRTFHPADPTLHSRGAVVRDALGLGETRAVAEWLGTLDAPSYNPFNLIFGTAGDLHVAYARRERARIEIEPVPAGLHILPNDRLGSPDFPKVTRARSLATEAAAFPRAELPEHLRAILADHDRPALQAIVAPPADTEIAREVIRELQAICVHTPWYGSRSATYVELRPGAVDRYLFADGPPCTTPFAEVTALLGAR